MKSIFYISGFLTLIKVILKYSIRTSIQNLFDKKYLKSYPGIYNENNNQYVVIISKNLRNQELRNISITKKLY